MKYEGIGLDDFEGQALFVGPTVFLKLSDRSRLTANWSFQAWGRSVGSTPPPCDLVNFERHQARLVLGVNSRPPAVARAGTLTPLLNFAALRPFLLCYYCCGARINGMNPID